MLKVERTEREIHLVFPLSFYDPAVLAQALQCLPDSLDYTLSQADNGVSLNLFTQNGNLEALTLELFAGLNGYPSFSEVELGSFKNAPRPRLSCIILLTANDLFVKNSLLPSLIRHSAPGEIEILLVYNGSGANLDQFNHLELISSEFGCVSKGYNAGARRARGEYLAIFHDDCLVVDPDWIEKCLQQLDQGYLAVTPQVDAMFEERLPNAKNVPLVMRTKDFFELGGYDEHYYIGYEDMDFTHQILAAGGQIAQVSMAHAHFEGMSTVIMYSQKPHLFRLLFGLNLLPPRCLPAFRDYYLLNLLKNPGIQRLRQEHLLYFINKFRGYLHESGKILTLAEEARLVQALGQDAALPFMQDRRQVIEFYRGLVG